ncbi:MAG TPA: NAD(P)-binding protein [Anaerolineaceae bacterium]
MQLLGQNSYMVAVVGAGPAGLFAAKELAAHNVFVCLFNRDIKPGGLAEYGIYPDKHKMKDGLRGQLHPILDLPNVRYYGNVLVGAGGDIRLAELRALGFQAVLVTAGAQGTKWLGLPGEKLSGVYHAKDIVYHYNRLPPYSEMQFKVGRRAAVIGMGNVMTDIVHWLAAEQHVDEVVAVARRGPAEVKFDKKELENIAAYLDTAAVDREIERVAPLMRAIGQDPQVPKQFIDSVVQKVQPAEGGPRFRLDFLASPTRMLDDGKGGVAGLEVEDNTLALENGEVQARGLGTHRVLDVDTVIFAIGDQVDGQLELPVQRGAFVKNPDPRFPIEGQSYEVSPQRPDLEGVFVAGWSRKASTGLVGVARKDGINGARAVLQYLDLQQPLAEIRLDALEDWLRRSGRPVVTAEHFHRLLEAEQACGAAAGIDHFKYASNAAMLEAMGFKLERS